MDLLSVVDSQPESLSQWVRERERGWRYQRREEEKLQIRDS
jgi:hypothetical protein